MKHLGHFVALGRLCWAGFALADSSLREAERRLEQAFDHLYEYDVRMVLRLEIQGRRGERSTRRSEIARKKIRGLTHSYANFLEPTWMRGTRMLLIDNADRGDDVFLFLPEADRVRRITSVQRSDAFLGTDFWYEDFERHRVTDYTIGAHRRTEIAGLGCYQIDASPRDGRSTYARVRFLVTLDGRLWRVLFFARDGDQPFRSIEFDLSQFVEQKGQRVPTRVTVENELRKSRTVAYFEQVEVDPELDDSLFRATALMTGRRVPGLTSELDRGAGPSEGDR